MKAKFDVFFSYGFRPFFLGCAIYGAFVMAAFMIWIGVHHAGGLFVRLPMSISPFLWHAHEMLFGFAMAAVAGFLLTAVPSWTGTHAVHGKPLFILFLFWLCGRIGVGFSASLPVWLAATMDLIFIPALGILVIGALSKGWSKRNLIFVPLLAGFFISNLLFHLELLDVVDNGIDMGLRLSVGLLALLISIIGGRVTPAFTTNALRRMGEQKLPVNHVPLNVLGILLVASFAITDTVAPEAQITGWLAAAAAVVNAARLAGWRGLKTFSDPLVAVLHIGFAWLSIGLGLKAWAILGDGLSPETALHALTAGAAGTMILAVMSRASLGHTGRPLVASRVTVAVYTLITMTTVIRVVIPPVFPEFYNEGMIVAGIGWIAAFTLFAIHYWTVLTGPRLGGRDA
ncbi:NnrS family protein [Thalassospiraceae bacterium LMO-JJ14]|nr:NnrS family protein [Thalassospiraceae bacterium LMO-JJ14]